MSKNNQKKIEEKNDNTPDTIILKTNIKGIKCRKETGIILLNLKGRITQSPFLRLFLQKDLKSERV